MFVKRLVTHKIRGSDFLRERSRITLSISTACARQKDLLSACSDGFFSHRCTRFAWGRGRVRSGRLPTVPPAGANEFAAGKSQSPPSWTAAAAAVRLRRSREFRRWIPRSRDRFTADKGSARRSLGMATRAIRDGIVFSPFSRVAGERGRGRGGGRGGPVGRQRDAFDEPQSLRRGQRPHATRSPGHGVILRERTPTTIMVTGACARPKGSLSGRASPAIGSRSRPSGKQARSFSRRHGFAAGEDTGGASLRKSHDVPQTSAGRALDCAWAAPHLALSSTIPPHPLPPGE